jgi:hypothetical protein
MEKFSDSTLRSSTTHKTQKLLYLKISKKKEAAVKINKPQNHPRSDHNHLMNFP